MSERAICRHECQNHIEVILTFCSQSMPYHSFTPLEQHLAAIDPPDAPPEGFTNLSKSKKSAADKAKKETTAEGKKKNAAGPSRAAESLRKADTKGMSKLSTFFKKK